MTIERAFASASTTLDQTSPTLVNSMTITPASGEYLLVFSGELRVDTATNGENTIFSVYVAGSQITGSEVRYEEDGSVTNCTLHITVTIEINPTGGQAVEIRYVADSGTTPLSMLNRELQLFPMTGGLEDAATGTDTLATATWTTRW